MIETATANIALLALIAVSAPLLARFVGRALAVPIVVFEILLGILLGPDGLGWVQLDLFTELVSNFGLAMLFFLAGFEINFAKIKGRPTRTAALGWLISLVLALGFSLLIAPDPIAATFIAIALTSTALGTIMPVLRDAGDMKTPFGVAVTAVGTVGEFAPLIAISLFLTRDSTLVATIVLVLFAVIAGLAVWAASRGAGPRLRAIITATLHTSAQFAVRFVLLIIIALVALSIALGLDMLLGAFTAGVLFHLLMNGAPEGEAEVIETKIEAIGFGLFVPVFFIYTGVTFDLAALLASPMALVLLPVFLLVLLLLRGIPSILSVPPGSTARDRAAMAFYGGTALPIIVAVTSIGIESSALTPEIAASLVGAGMLSVLIFPLLALTLRKRSADSPHDGPDTTYVPIVA